MRNKNSDVFLKHTYPGDKAAVEVNATAVAAMSYDEFAKSSVATAHYGAHSQASKEIRLKALYQAAQEKVGTATPTPAEGESGAEKVIDPKTSKK